jgi:hypothetical protein
MIFLRACRAYSSVGDEYDRFGIGAFTEHGAIMLASVLNSPAAVQASIYVVRAFVQMRSALLEYADLSRRVDELAATYDHRFQQVFIAIRNLMAVPHKSRRAIGFVGNVKRRRKLKP